MNTVRVVRPRPLALTDRIPVFWPGTEPSQELKQIDGGALLRHLVAATTPTASRKRKRTGQYHAPREGEAHEHWSPARRAAEQAAATGPIAIPKVRIIDDYHLNQQAADHHGPMISGNIAAAPYLRHQQPGVYDEHQQAEYVVDDEDLAWLNSSNTKNGQGLFAAAVGLYRQMSSRISGSSEASTPRAQDCRLSVDDFEQVFDALELAHFAAVKAWWEQQQQDGPSTSASQIPKIPAMKSLLPRGTALGLVVVVVPDRKLAAQLLDYWLHKRQVEGGPLLARLWFEQPWKFVAFARFVDSDDDDDDIDEHMPFMEVEPRSAIEQRRTAVNRRRISEEDAVEALFNMRSELEMLRTLADQVRKREKLKRQLLSTSQQEVQMRQELGLPPKAPVPKTARLHQLARTSSVAAAAAAAATETGATAGAAEAVRGLDRAESSAAAAARGTRLTAAAQKAGVAGRAASAGRSAGQQPAADISRMVAKAADAAAAAASPHAWQRPRQTRTAAAAAAAGFEIAFAAKRAKVAAEMGLPADAGGLAQLVIDSVMPPGNTSQQQQQRNTAAAKPPQRAGLARATGAVGAGTGRPSAQPFRGSKPEQGKAKRRWQQKQGAALAAAAADGDADDEREESAGQPAGRGPAMQHQNLDPPRRRRRILPEPAQQQNVLQQGHQQPTQMEQVTRQQGTQKQAPRQHCADGALACVAGPTAVPAAVSLSSSTSVTSDDSHDADYTVSSDEAEAAVKPLQRLNARQRSTHQLRGRGRQLDPTSSSDDSSHEQEEFEEDSDDHFQVPSRRVVALRRPRQAHRQAQQQWKLRQSASADAAEQVAVVVVEPRRKGRKAGQEQRVQQQQQAVSRPPRKQTMLQKRRSAVSTSLVSELAESNSESSSSGQESDLAVNKPLVKQQRLLRDRKPAPLDSAGPSGAAALPQRPGFGAARGAIDAPVNASTEGTERRVLRPHNHQLREVPPVSQRPSKQIAGQLRLPGAAGAKLSGNAATAGEPVPARRASSQQTRPASGSTRSGGAHRPAAATAVRRSLGRQQQAARAAIGAAELRSLGLQPPGTPSGRR